MAQQPETGHRPPQEEDECSAFLREVVQGARRTPVTSCASIDEWWAVFRDARPTWATAADEAIGGGLLADRVGYAFAAGYQAALRRLDPSLRRDRLACFSVTEEGGAHPRAIESALRSDPRGEGRWLLSGRKKWATLSSGGGTAVVVASTGKDAEERNRLCAVRVDLGSPGVSVERMPPPPFVPEIPHCRLRFDAVPIAAQDVLPGDGYTDYVKPFRTLEDTHVTAAVLAHLLGIAFRYDWPREVRAELLYLLIGSRSLALADPAAPEVHIALEGLAAVRQRVLEAAAPCWERVDADVRQRWERDGGLLQVAGKARALRLQKAWERLGVE